MFKSNLDALKKAELLQIIYEQEKQIEILKNEKLTLQKKLDDKTINLKEAGSIAEAALRINKIFETAQKAADEYVNSIKKLNENKFEENTEDYKKVENEELYIENLLEINVKNNEENIVQNFSLIPVNLGLTVKKLSIFKRIKILVLIIFKKIVIKIKLLTSFIKIKILDIISKLINGFKKIKNKLLVKLKKYKNKLIANLKNTRIKFLMFFAKLKNFKKSGKLKKFEKKNKSTLKAKKNKNIKEKLILKKSKNVELTDYDLSLENIESELKKLKNRESRFKFVKVSTYGIIVIVAITIIIVTRIFNVIQISGNSMEPTFSSGNLLISTKIFGYKKQDIIAFYYNNSVLIKRVIATGGDIVYIDDEGNVFVNSEQLEENYVKELAYGNCDITFPFTVPDKELFVLGDNRETSIDSRTKSIGTISENNILGKITVNINHFIFY